MMFIRTVVITSILLIWPETSSADLIINLTPSGSGVAISWTGSGELTAAIDETIELNDFSGNPFSADATTSIGPSDLRLDFETSEEVSGSIVFNSLMISNAGNQTTDLQFGGGFPESLSRNTPYSFENPPNGPITLTDLIFSDLNPGIYVSSRGDSSAFGTVTLNIAAVPEPATIVGSLFGLSSLWFAGRRRKRAALNGK